MLDQKEQQVKRSVFNVLDRLKRGLSGYVSYLAACEMNQAFSEYILYEPILRILTACGYKVYCEYPCPGLKKKGRGDQKKIDFYVTANGGGFQFAIEIKWARKKHLDVSEDCVKLLQYYKKCHGSRSFLCVFGRKSCIQELALKNNSLSEIGKAVYADFGVTRYGCRMFELRTANKTF